MKRWWNFLWRDDDISYEGMMKFLIKKWRNFLWEDDEISHKKFDHKYIWDDEIWLLWSQKQWFWYQKYNKINLLVVTKKLTKIDFRWVDLDICDQKKLILKSKDNSKNIIKILKISSMENLENMEKYKIEKWSWNDQPWTVMSR